MSLCAGRIQTLEEAMKDKGLPVPHKELLSVPPKSLLARVEMLESAMATMCQLQVRFLPNAGAPCHSLALTLLCHISGLVVRSGAVLQEARLQEEREFRHARDADVPAPAKGCCCVM